MDINGLIRRHEGFWRNAAGRHVAYPDSLGNPTVGRGTLLTGPLADALKRLWAAGPRGEYLTISNALADELLAAGIREAEGVVDRWLHDLRSPLSEVRRAALVDMAFCLGYQINEFDRLRIALITADWPAAAREILESDFARQTGSRARELADMMASDQWPA